MKKLLIILMTAIFVNYGAAFSAPMQQIGPMTIEGTVEEVSWSPDAHISGIAGMSGTLGTDRVTPAHYQVTLINTIFEVDSTKYKNEKYKDGQVMKVTISHQRDDGFLKKGMRIKIYGYTVNGDEGGYWYSFDKIDINRS